MASAVDMLLLDMAVPMVEGVLIPPIPPFMEIVAVGRMGEDIGCIGGDGCGECCGGGACCCCC